MAQKEKADAPLQIRNLAELKRCIQPGTKRYSVTASTLTSSGLCVW